jgi:hypothetical protein
MSSGILLGPTFKADLSACVSVRDENAHNLQLVDEPRGARLAFSEQATHAIDHDRTSTSSDQTPSHIIATDLPLT